jgi:ADP-heptose:LPS heptosyltransferase
MHLERLLDCESILLCGAPLREVCAVLERCDLFIGNDSGAAHLAAATDCKTIVISRHPRNGNPNHANSPQRFGPHCSEARVLQPAGGLDACADDCRVAEPHCITAVSVDDVVAAARAMLRGAPASFHPESAKPAAELHACRELPLAAITHLPDRVPLGAALKGRG